MIGRASRRGSAARPRIRLDPDQRRESILDAATRLLLRDSVTRLTMDRVAIEAHIAKGTIYYYWDSRSDLLRDLQERYIGELFAIAEALSADEIRRDPSATLERFLCETATLHYEQRAVLAALAREIPIEEERITERLHGVFCRFADAFGNLGSPQAAESSLVASFLLGGLHQILLRLLSDADPDLDSMIRQSLEMCRRVLGARAGAVSPH